jgi:Domain of unknown function (DUF4440)/Domain of unknown function (DUF3471)
MKIQVLRVCLAALLLPSISMFSQSDNSLDATIRQQDTVFWEAYNRCDVPKMSEFFWTDIEFYHDKGGLTVGLDTFVAALKNGLCGNPNSHLRREAIPETVKVFPLQKNGVIYGALISGEHYFFVNDNGKPEYRDSMARFFHVWLLKDGKWKMARVVSYDHRDAPHEDKRQESSLPSGILDQYVGKYKAAKSGAVTVSRSNNLLILMVGDKKFELHPESENVFFTTDRDLTFEFVKEGAKVSKFVVREHGTVTDEATAE